MTASFYAGLLALLYLVLTIRVVLGRYKHRVSLGDGGIPDLTQRIRIHSNFAEHVPFALLLLFMLDLSKAPPPLIHLLGIMLVVARLAHAWALSQERGLSPLRPVGVVLTAAVMMTCAIILIWKFLVIGATGF